MSHFVFLKSIWHPKLLSQETVFRFCQFINSNLPFGGIGNSGVGAYHGKHSFDLFTHSKPFIHRSFFPDPFIRYAPYPKKWGLIKKILNWISKTVVITKRWRKEF